MSHRKMLIPATVLVVAIAAAVSTRAGEAPPKTPSPVALPAPKTEGTVSVEAALKARRSIRTLSDKPLTLQQTSQLLWALQGITDDKGHRTAPSARAVYPLEVRLIAGKVDGLEAGIYRYDPQGHKLVPGKRGDVREEFVSTGVGQGWLNQVPAIFVISADLEKAKAKLAGQAEQWSAVEAGLAAQGFFLQAVALGLGSTYVGGFDEPETRGYLELGPQQRVLAVLPAGRPK